MSYAFFWFIPGVCSLNANVSEHCLLHLHRRVGINMEQTGCSEMLAFKVQTPGNNQEKAYENNCCLFYTLPETDKQNARLLNLVIDMRTSDL
jgi:hypothetical protein